MNFSFNELSSLHPLSLTIGMGALALLPVIIGCGTSYLKVSVVLGFLRSALGTTQIPNGITILGISCLVSLISMRPVLQDIGVALERVDYAHLKRGAWSDIRNAAREIAKPYADYLRRASESRERQLLAGHVVDVGAGLRAGDDSERMEILLLAYMLTELKRGCLIGLALLIPFLVIDLVVANILAGMGMVMVNPALVTLPLKLALFTMGDGWLLLSDALIRSYQFGHA